MANERAGVVAPATTKRSGAAAGGVTITWAVVDASCKAEDVGHRITLLGGVDVIALTGIADTISPAAVLGLGIPVGRIGSNPATPAVWADLLMERLER